MNLRTLFKINYGLYIVSSRNKERFNGQIANVVFQITSNPATIAVSINKQNLTHKFIKESGVFSISILSQDTPMKFISDFGFKSGRETDKFKNVKYKIGITGVPIVLDNAIGYIEAEVVDSKDVNTHTIFIGKIVDAEIVDDKQPMTYYYYHEIKRGITPKTAPTYVEEKQTRIGKKLKRYRCTICGYIYDPEKGDPDSGIKPGTPFEELPDDWGCPVCGADKSSFIKED